MQGKIIKGIAGFYYVQTEDKLYECKAKGIFRNKKMKPLVGDNVEIDILDETERADPSSCVKCRSGTDHICSKESKAKL